MLLSAVLWCLNYLCLIVCYLFIRYWGLFSHGYSRWDMMVTTHHVVPNLRISGTVTPLSHVPSWHADKQLQVLIVLISLIFSYFISWSFSEMTVKYTCKDIAIPLTHFSFSPTISQANNGTGISYHFLCQYAPDQHKSNRNKGLYMQPHKHTAFTRYCNVTNYTVPLSHDQIILV